jgi:hypothetical protein
MEWRLAAMVFMVGKAHRRGKQRMTDLSDLPVTNACPQCGQEWDLYETDVPEEYGGGWEKLTKCCDFPVARSPGPFRRTYGRD